MAYELNFNTTVTGGAALASVEQAITKISGSTKISSGELRVLEAALKSSVAAGNSLSSALKEVAASEQTFTKETRNAASALAQHEAAVKSNVVEIQKLGKTMDSAIAETAKRATVETRNLTDMIGGRFGSVLSGGTAVSTAFGIAIIGGAKAAIEASSRLAQYAQEVTNAAARTGLTTTEFQQFSRSAEVVGVNAGALTAAMRTLSRGLAEGSDEGKKQKVVLDELGIQATDSLGRIKPLGEILPQIFDKLGKLSAGPQRDFFLTTLFGRGGLEFAPLLGRLEELQAKINGVVSPEAIAVSEKYREQLNLLGQAWDSLVRKFSQPIVATFSEIIQGVQGDKTLEKQRLAAVQLRDSDPAGLTPGFFARTNGTAGPIEQARADFLRSIGTGNARLAQFNKNKPLEEQLRDAQQNLSAVREANPLVQGLPDSIQADREGKVSAAVKKVEELKARLAEAHKEARGTASALREINEAIQNLSGRKELISIPLAGGGSMQVESPGIISGADRELSRILSSPTLASLPPAQREDAIQRAQEARDERINTGIFDAEHAQRNFIGRNPRKAEDQYQNSLFKGESEASKAAGVNAERIAHAFEKNVHEIRNKIRKEDEPIFSGIRAAGNQQADLTMINARPGGELAALKQSLEIRLKAADVELKIKQLHKDVYDQVVAQAQYEDESQKARFEFEKAIAQERKKREGDFRTGAENLASAAITGGGGGAQSYLKGQGQGILTKIAGNVASMAYPTFQKTLGSAGFDPDGPIGKLLQGTPFAKHLDPAAMSTDLNTKSTDLNTAATLALVQQMGGNITGIASLPGGAASALSIPGLSSIRGFGSSGLPGLASSLLFRGSTTGIDNQVSENADDDVTSTQASGTKAALLSGYKGGSGIGLQGIFTGVGSGPGGVGAQSYSTSDRIQGGVVAAGAIAGAAIGAYQGFSKGGVRGDLSGASSLLGGAAAIAAMTGVGAPIAAALGIAALGTSLVGALFGDPRANRQHQLDKELGNSKYLEPAAINKTIDGAGNYTDYDRFGNVRTSPFVGNPTVTQPGQYYIKGQYLPIPGGVVSPFQTAQQPSTSGAPSNGSGASPIQVTVHTMDSQSFIDHADHIAGALSHHLSKQGGGQIIPQLRYALGS